VKIAVEGRDAEGRVVRYGTLAPEGAGVRATVEPGADAERWMAFVVKHEVRTAGGTLEPLTPEWLRALPRGLTGSRLWCRRA